MSVFLPCRKYTQNTCPAEKFTKRHVSIQFLLNFWFTDLNGKRKVTHNRGLHVTHSKRNISQTRCYPDLSREISYFSTNPSPVSGVGVGEGVGDAVGTGVRHIVGEELGDIVCEGVGDSSERGWRIVITIFTNVGLPATD